MESAGSSWKPAFNVLENSVEVVLTNAYDVHGSIAFSTLPGSEYTFPIGRRGAIFGTTAAIAPRCSVAPHWAARPECHLELRGHPLGFSINEIDGHYLGLAHRHGLPFQYFQTSQ